MRTQSFQSPAKSAILGALLGSAMMLSAPVLAGFIDERKSTPAPTKETGEGQPSPQAGAAGQARPSMSPAPATGGGAPGAGPAPAASRAPLLAGFGPAWDTPVQAAARAMPLALALNVLRPASEPAVPVMIRGVQGEILVSWPEGANRRQILNEMATKNSLLMRRTANQLVVIAAASIVPSGVVANAPAAALEKRKFEVRLQDVRLHVAMQRWAADTGVRLRWDADRHVLISAPMVFEATDALQAVGMALSTPGIANSAYPLEVCEYPNVPVLLRITRQGEQGKDCSN
jgi:hypothetical protein